MEKRKRPSSSTRTKKTPKRLIASSTPAINLTDELQVAYESLASKRTKQNEEQEYALVTTVKSIHVKDINDEFTREYLFSEQAKEAAAKAIARMRELDIPSEIPKTYKGELVKDEKQMAKIRDNLKSKKDAIEISEKMKKLRELKKIGKKIQTEVLQKRNKEKKEFLEKVKKKPVSELFEDIS